MSGYYVKAEEMEPGSIGRMVAMCNWRRRIKRKTLERIMTEFESLNVRVNAVCFGRPFGPVIANTMRVMLTKWSEQMCKAGLFPMPFLPKIVYADGTVTVSWVDPSGLATIVTAPAAPATETPETVH